MLPTVEVADVDSVTAESAELFIISATGRLVFAVEYLVTLVLSFAGFQFVFVAFICSMRALVSLILLVNV